MTYKLKDIIWPLAIHIPSFLFFNLLNFFPVKNCHRVTSSCFPRSNSLTPNQPEYPGENRQMEVCCGVRCPSAPSLFFSILFCTSGAGSLQNYTSQTPLPVGFLLSFTSGRHWQEAGENRKPFFFQILMAVSATALGTGKYGSEFYSGNSAPNICSLNSSSWAPGNTIFSSGPPGLGAVVHLHRYCFLSNLTQLVLPTLSVLYNYIQLTWVEIPHMDSVCLIKHWLIPEIYQLYDHYYTTVYLFKYYYIFLPWLKRIWCRLWSNIY